MKTDRCTTVTIRLEDLDRSVEDPKLAMLLANGWKPFANVTIASETIPPSLVVLLAPPEPAPKATPEPKATPDALSKFGAVCGAVALVASIASLLLGAFG